MSQNSARLISFIPLGRIETRPKIKKGGDGSSIVELFGPSSCMNKQWAHDEGQRAPLPCILNNSLFVSPY